MLPCTDCTAVLLHINVWREHIHHHILDFDLPARAVSRIVLVD